MFFSFFFLLVFVEMKHETSVNTQFRPVNLVKRTKNKIIKKKKQNEKTKITKIYKKKRKKNVYI